MVLLEDVHMPRASIKLGHFPLEGEIDNSPTEPTKYEQELLDYAAALGKEVLAAYEEREAERQQS